MFCCSPLNKLSDCWPGGQFTGTILPEELSGNLPGVLLVESLLVEIACEFVREN